MQCKIENLITTFKLKRHNFEINVVSGFKSNDFFSSRQYIKWSLKERIYSQENTSSKQFPFTSQERQGSNV